MTTATIFIEKCIQDVEHSVSTQDNTTMYSQLFFSIQIGGQIIPNISVEISQPFGSDYLHEPMKIGQLSGYHGPFNFDDFRAGVAKYYRSLMVERGSITSLGKGVLRTRDKTFNYKAQFDIEID